MALRFQPLASLNVPARWRLLRCQPGSPGAYAPVERDQARSDQAVCLVDGSRAGGPNIFAIYVGYRTRL
jgi:hypothetical protein